MTPSDITNTANTNGASSVDASVINASYRKIVRLHFSPKLVHQALVCDLVRRFDITFSILKSRVNPKRDGYLTLEIDGAESNCLAGLEYLRSKGVKVSFASKLIERNEESCMHCGMCTAICPVDALYNDRKARLVIFDAERCIGCGACVKVCPVKAMHKEVDDE